MALFKKNNTVQLINQSINQSI